MATTLDNFSGVWTSARNGSLAFPCVAVLTCFGPECTAQRQDGQRVVVEISDSKIGFEWNRSWLWGQLASDAKSIVFDDGDCWTFLMTLSQAIQLENNVPTSSPASDEFREHIFHGDAITTEGLFHRTIMELLDECGSRRVDLSWSSLDETCRASVKEVSEEMILFSMRFDSAMPVALAKQLLHPEYQYHISQRTEDMPYCGVEEVLVPGDIIAWRVYSASKSNFKNVALFCSPEVFPEGWDGRFLFRSTLQEDFPLSGRHLLVHAPWDPLRRTSIDKIKGSQRVTGYFLEPSMRGSRHRVFQRLPRVCQELYPLMVGQMSQWMKRIQDRLAALKLPAIYTRNFSNGPLGYVVVALRKCNSGPPLMPIAGSAAWEEVPRDGFSLPVYLSALLERLGLEVPVYDCLFGKWLAPYQAALTRGAWEFIQPNIEVSLALQRPAYRRMHGGTGAPHIVLVSGARYIETAQPPPGEVASSTVDVPARLPIQNTFLHFRQRPQIQRAQSVPAVARFLDN